MRKWYQRNWFLVTQNPGTQIELYMYSDWPESLVTFFDSLLADVAAHWDLSCTHVGHYRVSSTWASSISSSSLSLPALGHLKTVKVFFWLLPFFLDIIPNCHKGSIEEVFMLSIDVTLRSVRVKNTYLRPAVFLYWINILTQRCSWWAFQLSRPVVTVVSKTS